MSQKQPTKKDLEEVFAPGDTSFSDAMKLAMNIPLPPKEITIHLDNLDGISELVVTSDPQVDFNKFLFWITLTFPNSPADNNEFDLYMRFYEKNVTNHFSFAIKIPESQSQMTIKIENRSLEQFDFKSLRCFLVDNAGNDFPITLLPS